MNINATKCRLCLKTELNLLNIFDEQTAKKTIASVLSQHFWFEVQEDDVNQYICELCWLSVDNFHSFYIQVQEIHNNFESELNTLIKVERNIDEIFLKRELKHIKEVDFHEETSYDDHQRQSPDDSLSYDDGPPAKNTKIKKNRKELDPIDKVKIERENQQIGEYLPMECELCATRCNNFQNLQHHYRKAHKTRGYLRCCKRKFKERSNLIEHIQWHLNPETFKCDKCDKTYANKRGLKQHQSRHLYLEEKPFKCSECPKSYTTAFFLKEHVATHKTSIKFSCDDCGKSFDAIRLLKAHETNIHTRANIHICDVCAKEFRGKSLLEHHHRTIHQNVHEKVQCQLCGIWLKHKYQLSQHMVRHEESKMNLSCDICGKRSLNRKALRSHIKVVHTDNMYKCTLCDKTFKKQISLKEHMATHTGDTLYTCSYCPKTFNSSANMYSHKKKIHVKEWEERERLKAAGIL